MCVCVGEGVGLGVEWRGAQSLLSAAGSLFKDNATIHSYLH